METLLSPPQALVTIFSTPRRVFDAIQVRPMALWPLAIAVLGNVTIWLWYYQAVDFAWLQDYLIEQNTNETDAFSKQVVASVLTRTSLSTLSVGTSLTVIPILFALLATYFLAAGKILGEGRPYKQWFGFVAWGTAPTLLLLPVMALQILLSPNGQLAPEALNPLSLDQLFFHLRSDSPWRGLLGSLSVPTMWSGGLLAFGLRQWTGRNWPTAIGAAVLPFAALYVGWTLKITLGG